MASSFAMLDRSNTSDTPNTARLFVRWPGSSLDERQIPVLDAPSRRGRGEYSSPRRPVIMGYVVDCREQPSENNCTLTIAGERGEVLKAAVEHAISSHGHTDSEELRSAIESALEPEPTAAAS
jgi:predicted small metal-binding protein